MFKKEDLPLKYSKLSAKQRREVRELYTELQDGLCMYCNYPLTGDPAPETRQIPIHLKLFPKGFFRNPVHLQHDHSTDLTEGAVHCICNSLLWQYHGR